MAQAAKAAKTRCPALSVQIFSDRDIEAQRQKIEAALSEADVFFGSLLFDYDQVGAAAGGHKAATSIPMAAMLSPYTPKQLGLIWG